MDFNTESVHVVIHTCPVLLVAMALGPCCAREKLASVPEYHSTAPAGGAAGVPPPQSAGQGHDTGVAAPPVQNAPAGHATPAAEVAAYQQEKPGAAVAQGAVHEAVASPVEAPYTPGGQGVGNSEPTGQK